MDEKKGYSAAEMWKLGGQNGWSGAIDAVGVWSLAADRDTGLVGGRDVVGFQEGVLCDRLEARRKGTGDVLPFLRGGPGWVAGHSWMVRTMFGVRVYEEGRKVD